MTRILTLLCLIFFPTLGSAQQVSVRSGEHGDFTRLVFNIPTGTNWSISPSTKGNKLRLNLEMNPTYFDTSTVFEKISKARVSALMAVPEEAAIDIELACNCVSEAFIFQNKMLVVDVKEKLVSATDDTGREIDLPIESQLQAGSLTRYQADFTKVWLSQGPRIGPKKSANPMGFDTPLASAEVSGPEISNSDPFDNSQAEMVRAQIFGDVASAATQGLLNPTSILKQPPRKFDDVSLQKPGDLNDLSADVALRELVLDRTLEASGRISIGGQQCVPDALLSFTKWEEDTDDVSLVLATRRGAVFGEFDKINNSVMNSYVKSLLYFSFGAEAREALTMIGGAENKVFHALSYLVDGDSDPSQLFQDQFACEGLAAVWAVVDGTGLRSTSEIDEESVLQGFEMLPKHLREQLGPKISQNLSKNGFSAPAKDILRRLERMLGEETNSITLGKAQIQLMGGNIDQASTAFNNLAESQSPETAEAIVSAVEIAEQTGVKVSDRVVELSAAYSTELRNTDAGSEMWEAHLKSLTINGRFEDALDVLNKVEGVNPKLVEEARNDIFEAIFDRADDVSFLRHFFLIDSEHWNALGSTQILSAARRMMELGLPNAAIGVLGKVSEQQLDREKRLLQARALLDLSRPEESEILLIGLQGQEVSRLRAVARSQMGDHNYARSIFSELGQKSDAQVEAWLSGDWERVSEVDDGPLSSAADMIQSEPNLNSPNRVSLADVESLFKESYKSRETIKDILEATLLEN
ncbi:tetratricopeptide repeat protein [Pelagimonas varians]|uniref:Tetratricopeptide repeat protein n=1 Tax=Pelagimonas varians TaxID=696760 RepID=A0A238L2X9_9RHOB|nr:hypothetical protein [Pelagimonas varians]PYG26526.1 hypothetical protein C8N36_1213 [Pelagimonas varians]SMX49337.1 hypothetical protein PEV8663_04164 [Pelagimonas varians]